MKIGWLGPFGLTSQLYIALNTTRHDVMGKGDGTRWIVEHGLMNC
jgi:hypothetical protein